MRAIPAALFALVFGAAATVPAFGIASVNVFGLKAPEEIEGFTLNDSTNFEKIRPGDGYGLDYSQSGWKLDVFIYDLKRAAIPDDAKSAIVKAGVSGGVNAYVSDNTGMLIDFSGYFTDDPNTPAQLLELPFGVTAPG